MELAKNLLLLGLALDQFCPVKAAELSAAMAAQAATALQPGVAAVAAAGDDEHTPLQSPVRSPRENDHPNMA